jgi:hypothetical protein
VGSVSEQTGGLHNHCKGSDAKVYTDTNKNQANDFYPGSPAKRTANAWFNGLTATKAAHNTMMMLKMLQQESSATVPGISTNRVYDPVAPVAKPGRFWTAEDLEAHQQRNY